MARRDDSIILLTPQELERDLEENGKFNRQNSERVRKELTQLNMLKMQDEEMKQFDNVDNDGQDEVTELH